MYLCALLCKHGSENSVPPLLATLRMHEHRPIEALWLIAANSHLSNAYNTKHDGKARVRREEEKTYPVKKLVGVFRC